MTKHECSDESDDSFWFEERAPFIREEPDTTPVYDLEQRTARFGEAIIDFAKKIPLGPVTDRIISQLVGAATSVGANYDEADDAVSKKDFLKCIGTCKKEARESKHFLRMVARAVPELKSGSARAVARSQRVAPDLCQDLEERPKTMTEDKRNRNAESGITAQEPCVPRHWSFGIDSSFVIRHSSLQP